MKKKKRNVLYLDDYRDYYVAEVICVACYHRWIGTYSENTLLKDIECPHCGKKGTIITTGQPYFDDQFDE